MPGTGLQYIGDTSLKFEAMRIGYGPKGNVTYFRVTCPSLPALITYYNYIVTFGASGTFTGADGGEERALEVELPGLVANLEGVLSELFFDQWEFLSNESSDTIFSNPTLIAPIGSTAAVLNYNAKIILSDLALNGGTPPDAVLRVNANRTTSTPPGTLAPPDPTNGGTSGGEFTLTTFTAAQYQIALDVQKGQIEFQKPTYVLRHTSYISAGSTYNASVADTMKLYTTSQLLSETSSGWIYNLPPRLVTKIGSIPTQAAPGSEATYYSWTWLKKITRECVLPNFMVEVSTEYELALWPNLEYELK